MEKELKAAGFEPIETDVQPRLIIALDGQEKCGKTHFSLTAPDPIAYFAIDLGHEGVVRKFTNGEVAEKTILRADKAIKIPDTVRFNKKQDTIKIDAEDAWDKMRKAYKAACQSSSIRTIVVDTATEMWELIRLARLGKLSQVKPQHYGPVNAEMRGVIRDAYNSNKNVILIHKMKKEYKKEQWSGKYERAGFSDMGYLVQVNATMECDKDGDFSCTINDCRQNTSVRGMVFEDMMCSFPFVAASIFPETKLEMWE
jgi:hypothetical protein